MRLIFAATLLVIAGCAPEEPKQPAPEPEDLVNHFKIWQTRQIALGQEVTLFNQWDEAEDREPRTVTLDPVVWIANPVFKTRNDKTTKPVNKNHHLIGYFIDKAPVAPMHRVRLSNQFTEGEDWKVLQPAVLLVPASKVLRGAQIPPPRVPEPPEDLDHYECFTVKSPGRRNVALVLQDQFDRFRGKNENITSIEPAFFCLPVSKNGSDIINERVHLALYDILPRTKLDDTILARARDQFFRTGVPLPIAASESLLLAVPSDKLEFEEYKEGKDQE